MKKLIIVSLICTLIFSGCTTANTLPTEEAQKIIDAVLNVTPEVSLIPEVSATPDITATPEITVMPEVSATPEITSAPEVSATPEVTAPPEVTVSPEVSATPTVSPEVSATPEVTITPTATPAVTQNITLSPTATLNITPSPTPKITVTPTIKVTATPKPTPVPTPVVTPTPKPTATPTQKPTATPAPTTETNVVTNQMLKEIEEGFLRLVNYERSRVGASKLTINSYLDSYAQTRSKEITTFFDHTRPDGSAFYSGVDGTKYNYSTLGENICMTSHVGTGVITPFTGSDSQIEAIYSHIYTLFRNSPGHYENMISTDFEHCGIGLSYTIEKGIPMFYCAHIFGSDF